VSEEGEFASDDIDEDNWFAVDAKVWQCDEEGDEGVGEESSALPIFPFGEGWIEPTAFAISLEGRQHHFIGGEQRAVEIHCG
jgi:hypothetical protein